MKVLLNISVGGLCMLLILLSQAANAQVQHFCATYEDTYPEDCSFTSMEMCEQSVNGVGGQCRPQSEAPATPPPARFHLLPWANVTPVAPPAPVPPPPGSGSPLPLNPGPPPGLDMPAGQGWGPN
jgi:hypothetical protein